MNHLIFVYGTLKRGNYNNRILGDSKFLCTASTEGGFSMYSVGYPLLISTPGEGHRVVGEVFEVNETTLDTLDRLERHPHHYRRQFIRVVPDADSEGVSCGEGVMVAEAYIYEREPYGEVVEPIDGILEWQPEVRAQ